MKGNDSCHAEVTTDMTLYATLLVECSHFHKLTKKLHIEHRDYIE